MRLPRSLALVGPLALLLAGPGPRAGETLTPVAEGVFVALQPHAGRFDDSNSVVILRGDGVVVVDAQSDAGFVRDVIAAIRGKTDLPVRYLIATHWHADHTQGAALYREAFGTGVEIVAHESVREDVQRAAADVAARVERLEGLLPAAEQQLAGGLKQNGDAMTPQELELQRGRVDAARRWLEANRDAVFLEPTLTYATELTLGSGEGEIRLFHVRAHTRGDTIVHLPSRRILISGDVVDDLPYVGHGFPRSWLASLDRLEALEPRLIVPGHGPVFRDTGRIGAIRAYLNALVDHADGHRKAGDSFEQAREQFEPGAIRRRLAGDDESAGAFFDSTVEEALERAWNEEDG